jgi:hypothetical protein
MSTNNELLAELNAFRAQHDLPPFADWRKARHMPMLETHRAEEEAKAALAAEEAKKAERKAKRTKKDDGVPAYKRMPHGIKSVVDSPVAFVHAFLDANPDRKRKAAVNALIQAGVNFSTARTQYQRWSANRKAGAGEVVKDAE